jgi:3D (Asp-Asp-Asp) domain-containing protein
MTLTLAIVGTSIYYEKELSGSHKTISNLENETEIKLAEIAKLEGVIESKNGKLKEYEEMIGEYSRTNNRLENEIQSLKEELNKYDSLRQLDVVATAYDALCNTGCTGVTATGHNVKNTVYKDGYRVVAVDPNVIPLGSLVHVEAEDRSFVGIAEDTGGDIKGRRVDVLMKDRSRAYAFGRQEATITVIREGNEG